MAALALMFAALLAYADRKLRVEEDPRIGEISSLLPNVNCGACGYLSCHDFAEHIVKEGADPGKCRIISDELKGRIYELSGSEAGENLPKYALVKCSAKTENKSSEAVYSGIRTCRAADLVFGGGMQCRYGCIGFGDCEQACPFDAIHVINGLAVVDPGKCTGCGKCVEACPRGIISLAVKKYESIFYVACSSHDDGKRVREVCGVGCIACGICSKLSGEELFKMKDRLSVPELSKQEKTEEIRKIAAKCPTKVIKEPEWRPDRDEG
jgi:Na+-translocating ferredoxin:NAD+ oxidoreductase RNF subunit RnfB